ncbi:DUF167 domain-containing protein [Candidatus Bathyarchaeota archaeon]|nr:DUF167 domain-containing protein [Candidatus Bathyarchaeota archaeon]
MSFYETKHGAILQVSVKPRSKEFKIVTEGDEIMVFCREEPVKGKVNKELVKELSRLFHKKVELVSGFASKQKKLLIRNAEGGEVEHLLFHK